VKSIMTMLDAKNIDDLTQKQIVFSPEILSWIEQRNLKCIFKLRCSIHDNISGLNTICFCVKSSIFLASNIVGMSRPFLNQVENNGIAHTVAYVESFIEHMKSIMKLLIASSGVRKPPLAKTEISL
jgi:predicted ATP-grasp superfamily ATP-dependent carboligase